MSDIGFAGASDTSYDDIQHPTPPLPGWYILTDRGDYWGPFGLFGLIDAYDAYPTEEVILVCDDDLTPVKMGDLPTFQKKFGGPIPGGRFIPDNEIEVKISTAWLNQHKAGGPLRLTEHASSLSPEKVAGLGTASVHDIPTP